MHFTFNGKPGKTLSLLALSTVLLGQVPGNLMMAMAQDAGQALAQSSFWDFNSQSNQLRLTLSPGVAPRYFLLARPMRIAIEFPSSLEVSPQSVPYAEGAVEQLTLSPQSNGNLRITLQLRSGVELQPKQVALQQIDAQRWLITPLLASPTTPNTSGLSDISSIADSSATASLPSGARALQEPSNSQDLSPAATLAPVPLSAAPDLAPVSLAPGALNQWPTQIVELSPQPPTVAVSAEPVEIPSTAFPQERSILEPSILEPSILEPSHLAPSSGGSALNPSALPPQPLQTQVFSTPSPALTDAGSSPQVAPAPLPQNIVSQNQEPQADRESSPRETQTIAASASEPPAELETRPLPVAGITAAPTEPTAVQSTAVQSTGVQTPDLSPPAAQSPRSTAAEFPVATRPIVAPPVVQTPVREAEADRQPVVLPAVPLNPVPVATLPRSTSQGESTVNTAIVPSPDEFDPQVSVPVAPLKFGEVLPIQGSTPVPIPEPVLQSRPAEAAAVSETPTVTRPLKAVTVPGTTRRSTLEPAPVAATPPQPQSQRSTSNILLAKGSPIPLRYTGTVPLQVSAGDDRQEVLLVDEDIKSAQGQVIIPGGSEVLGRFETSWRGSRFIAQAISFSGYNQAFGAKSERLDNDRSPNPVGIGAGSGSGAIAGTLLAGGFGALGGAAIGAVSGYFMSPQPITLEPHQILMVYLAEDWLAY
ncbi:MAG: AMIN domain-containing protein [Prochlorotrichaceae cyanobacterium]